jgi:uncharacterized protein (DUF1330 family)
MVAYVIADIHVTDPERYEGYKQLAPAAIAKHGGRYLARGGHMAMLEGDWRPERVVILEFPSLDQAKTFYASVEYTAARRARGNAARMNMIVVEGV